jgi:rhamnose utilization protein RhaD (predicted bifunctional aldolase and dehydrogenase)
MSKNPLITAPELVELIERTRVIGSDPSLVVHGGGNTSAKGVVKLEDGQERRVMWIKASGGDMATATPHTFAPLDLDAIDALRVHDELTDEEMVELVSKTSLLAGAPRPSIETLLHGFMPFKHIDHVHADAICALTNHPNGREATLEALGDEWAYVEWMRSGFPLSKVVEKLGDYRGVILAHHGVITWAETSERCLEETHSVVARAQEFLDSRGPKTSASKVSEPDLHALLPVVRGHLSAGRRRLVRVDRRLKDIASRPDVESLVSAGVSSADHMLRIRPFSVVLDDLSPEGIDGAFERYAKNYDP